MRASILIIIFSFLPVFGECQKVGNPKRFINQTQYFQITLIEGGVWSWFSDPRAIYIPSTGEVVVGCLQRVTSTTGQRRLASYKNGVVTLGPSGWNEGDDIDDHNLSVAIKMANDTFITAYSDHVSPTGAIYYRIGNGTTIENFQSVQTVGPRASTYANLHEIGDTIIHIWRDANLAPGDSGVGYWIMRKSGDYGATWGNRIMFYWEPDEGSPSPPYLISRKTSQDRIDFLCTNAHPDPEFADNSVYHFYMERDSFFAVDGTFIVDPNDT